MKKTKIQWCHSTVNPEMGCDGCELWPGKGKIVSELTLVIIAKIIAQQTAQVQKSVASLIGNRATSEIYSDRVQIADLLAAQFHLAEPARSQLVDAIRKSCKCYAGLLGTMRAGQAKGHADKFEEPIIFPGRMADAARWGPPSPEERAAKPWLAGAPRMIFLSDMGDALSESIPSEYLQSEIIDVADSDAGRRHLWLWLTKRPDRMADFGNRLLQAGIRWPDNLVAMTSVTSPATAGRAEHLRRVPSRFKGLSCEPVFAELTLNLASIDWVIMGGGSDVLADAFHVEWALSLREQCRQADVSFFLKQLGRNAIFKGQPLNLVDGHGGDWGEWKRDWRTREIPKSFQTPGILNPAGTGIP
jgi:protein gp37